MIWKSFLSAMPVLRCKESCVCICYETLIPKYFSTVSVLPALLQKVVGDFFKFWEGHFAGNLVGILRDFFGPTK